MALGNVYRRFVRLCRELKLFTEAVVAIDGSKFKAVNNRERNHTPGKIERRDREPEERIQRYLDAMETADRTQPRGMQAKTERLLGKVQKMGQRMQELQAVKAQLETLPDQQLSQTDPDARAPNRPLRANRFEFPFEVRKLGAASQRHRLPTRHHTASSDSRRWALPGRDMLIAMKRLFSLATCNGSSGGCAGYCGHRTSATWLERLHRLLLYHLCWRF